MNNRPPNSNVQTISFGALGYWAAIITAAIITDNVWWIIGGIAFSVLLFIIFVIAVAIAVGLESTPKRKKL